MFINQFILTKHSLSTNNESEIIDFADYYLFYHKSLNVTNFLNENIQIVVIGNIYDYKNPTFSNWDIVKEELGCLDSFEDVLNKTYAFSGEYLVLYYNKYKNEMKVFTDLAAQFELFYSVINKENIVASSSYNLIEKIIPLEEDTSPEAKEFFSSSAFKKRKSFVGDDTNFLNLKRLKPNHYLNLINSEVIRYFPVEKIRKTSIKDVYIKGAEILKGYITSAANRQNLLIPVSAGWDSRLILAASKDISEKTAYYVFQSNSKKKKYDSAIPERLFKLLGLPFHIYNIPDSSKESYNQKSINYLNNNILFPRNSALTYAEFYKNYSNYLILNGNVSEIARLEFDEVYFLSPQKIALIEKYPHFDYSTKRYNKWFDVNQSQFKKTGFRILDMLYWEENCANWVSKSKSERRALGFQSWSPFNSREFILLLYGLPKKYRRKQNPVVYKKMIEHLWPELLKVPVNPGRKKIAMRITQSLGIFPIFRNIKLWWNLIKGRRK